MQSPSATAADVGRAVQRVVGDQLSRFRDGETDAQCAPLTSLTPLVVAQRLAAPRMLLQVCAHATPGALVVDIDSLDGRKAAVDATLANERLYYGCVAMHALVLAASGIELNLALASGRKGVHLIAAGSRLDAGARLRMAQLIPGSADSRETLATRHPHWVAAISDTVDRCFEALRTLVEERGLDDEDDEWLRLVRIGAEGDADARLQAVMPFADLETPTMHGVVRVPLATKKEADGRTYRSTPLPFPSLDAPGLVVQLPGGWRGSLVVDGKTPVTEAEVALLDAVALSTFRRVVPTGSKQADLSAAQLRVQACMLRQRRTWWPRFPERHVPLPTNEHSRDKILPGSLRALAARSAAHKRVCELLYDGCRRGGMWPSQWIGEPPNWPGRPLQARQGVWREKPVAICILEGMSIDEESLAKCRFALVRTLAATDFPLDAIGGALAVVLKDVRVRFGTLFRDIMQAKQGDGLSNFAWSYSRGGVDLNVTQPPWRRQQAAKAYSLLARVSHQTLRSVRGDGMLPSGSDSAGTQSESSEPAEAVGQKRKLPKQPKQPKRPAVLMPLCPPTPPEQWKLPLDDPLRAAPGDERSFEERVAHLSPGEAWYHEFLFLFALGQLNGSRTVPIRCAPGLKPNKEGVLKHQKNAICGHSAKQENGYNAAVYDQTKLYPQVADMRAQPDKWKRMANHDAKHKEPYKLNILLDDVLVIDVDDAEAHAFFLANIYAGHEAEFDAAPVQNTRQGTHWYFLRPTNCKWVYCQGCFGLRADGTKRAMDLLTVTGTNRSRGNLNLWPSPQKMWVRSLHDTPLKRMSDALHVRIDQLRVRCNADFA